MKVFLSILLLAGISAAAGASEPGVTIVAHRGAMEERPENTMPAFERAVEAGAHVIEADVWLSSDGSPFILHDATLDRTTDAEGTASERTLEELRNLDAGAWFDEAYAGARIPSLAELLRWADGRATLLLDLKDAGEAFTQSVTEDVRAHGNPTGVVIGVRSPEQARAFRESLPEARQLAFMPSPSDIPDFAEAGVDILRLWLGWLEDEPGLAAQVRETGAKLMVNGTTGELEEARALMAFEPDWILIDDPAQLLRSLEAMARTE